MVIFVFVFVCCKLYNSYHTGSLAFGAAIITIIQIIRAILVYLETKLKRKHMSIHISHRQEVAYAATQWLPQKGIGKPALQ